VRLAYADPPYPGKAHLYPECREVDHRELLHQLDDYDGWALSTDERNLQFVLSLAPFGVRVLAWCKPDAVPFHGPWQSWEPVICQPARPERAGVRSYHVGTGPPRGFCAEKTFTGSKPAGFCEWVIRCLGADPGDTLDDFYPGTGVMGRTWDTFRRQIPLWNPNPSHIGAIQLLRRHHPQLPGMPDPVVAIERQAAERNVA
jgi:hypothetical protein